MKGAVSTIVLVLIAVVVVGAIALNYYKPAETPSIPKATVTERDCQSKLSAYCSTWNSNRYSRESVSAGGRPGPWSLYARGCDVEQPTTSDCDRVSSTSAVTGRIAEVGILGFLESCNPNRDVCTTGLVCKLGRDNIYRCLRAE